MRVRPSLLGTAAAAVVAPLLPSSRPAAAFGFAGVGGGGGGRYHRSPLTTSSRRFDASSAFSSASASSASSSASSAAAATAASVFAPPAVRTSRGGGRSSVLPVLAAASVPSVPKESAATSSSSIDGDDHRRASSSSSTSSSSTASPSAPPPPTYLDRAPRKGDVVTIDLNLRPRDDFVPERLFDASGRVAFVLGAGNYLPGLHDLVYTMKPGGSVVGAVVDAGWGDRREELVARVPKDNEGGGEGGLDYGKIEVGTELMLANGMKCTVTEVTDADFTIDANPPLAGATYSADVTLVSVEEGPVGWGSSDKKEEEGPTNGEEKKGEDGEEAGAAAEERRVSRYETATLALGCFWGGELAYMRLPGVVGTKVGYSQGHAVDPTYEDVCSGKTGHTESIRIAYDPNVVTYREIVRMGLDRLGDSRYMLNRVGNDRGTQYRHGVYYHTPEQEVVARDVVVSYGKECKTEVLPASRDFYDAEEYHQQYLLKGGQSARKGEGENIRCYG